MNCFALLLCLIPSAPKVEQYRIWLTDRAPILAEQWRWRDQQLLLGEDKYDISRCYRIERISEPIPGPPQGERIGLVHGDIIAGRLLEMNEDRLSFDNDRTLKLAKPLAFPNSVVAYYVRQKNIRFDPFDLETKRKQDQLWLNNGDRLFSSIQSINREKNNLEIQSGKEARTLAFEQIQGFVLSTELARDRAPRTLYHRIILDDGTRLSLVSIAVDKDELSGQTFFKQQLSIALQRVVRIEAVNGPGTHLSTLKPSAYKYHSANGEEYSYRLDRSIENQPLVLAFPGGTSTFDRGLGLHAEASISYALEGKYRRFTARAGLDAVTGSRGSAILEIWLDGKKVDLPGGGKLTGKGSFEIDLELNKAKELTIKALPGPGGIVQDHVNLADPVLLP